MKNTYVKPEAVKVSFELADAIMDLEGSTNWGSNYFGNLVENDSTVFE